VEGATMKKFALKVLNPILALIILNQIFSALLSNVLSHRLFEKIHETGGFLLIIGVVIHILLNWSWVKTTYLKK
jgi:hypothetical protein